MNRLKDLMRDFMSDEIKDEVIGVENLTSRDIAIIGISCRIAKANNTDEYWEMLCKGEDSIRPLPEARVSQNESYMDRKGIHLDERAYYKGGFLDQIDKFDYELFSISPREASLMSPSQRLFLEAVWNTLEDAGYAGKQIKGSKTGIYLGHSTDFGESYKAVIEVIDPSMGSLAIPGNINSIIASRISYLLNLKGPSVVVDTACSSSLSAVHLACQALRNQECEMAIAGSVKVDLLPLLSIRNKEDELGITSSDGRTRAFDDYSEGTGLGEGVVALLLKPVDQAEADRDFIYAVIKGSSMNQDGSSVGLTAPNSAAQEEVIVSSWKDAGIDPETISYIEAHGTGTKLGDPIEINGIERAFKRYTNKQQFCGIGSVKSNIGHLDHTAGLAGLVKAVLCLKNKKLPPSIHFNKPNKKINFVDSPVFLNDTLRTWETKGGPRRCGVSAFGLSGTNCHVVLEEAPLPKVELSKERKATTSLFILSAKNEKVLRDTARQYVLFLNKNMENTCLQDLCYTVNTGREHFSYRLAILCDTFVELREELCRFSIDDKNSLHEGRVFHGVHKLVPEGKAVKVDGEKTQEQIRKLTDESNRIFGEFQNLPYDHLLPLLARLYVEGADVDWAKIYTKANHRRLSLPGYAFNSISCWITRQDHSNVMRSGMMHPLLDKRLVSSMDRIIYESTFTVADHWILHDHIVNGLYVVPGTVYLELIVEAVKQNFPGKLLQLKHIFFLSPLIASPNENKIVHTIIRRDGEGLEFVIASRSNEDTVWTTHAEGVIQIERVTVPPKRKLDELKLQCSGGSIPTYSYQTGKGIKTGDRWNCVKNIYHGTDELLAFICMKEEYSGEVDLYTLHPALLDEAVNLALRSIGEDLYLPFSYGAMSIMGKLPKSFYAYAKKKASDLVQREIAVFDVLLMDENGQVLVEIQDYSIKKVTDKALIQGSRQEAYQLEWVKAEDIIPVEDSYSGAVLVFKGTTAASEMIIDSLKVKGLEVIEVSLGDSYVNENDKRYIIQGCEEHYVKLFNSVKNKRIEQIIHLLSLVEKKEPENLSDLEDHLLRGVHSLFFMARAILKAKWMDKLQLVVAADLANEVTGNEPTILPHHAALFGICQVIPLEYPKLNCRCIDIDPFTTTEQLLAEIMGSNDKLIALREGSRYRNILQPVELKDKPELQLRISEDGVYVITGGLGGLGLQFAKYLTSKNKVNVVLLNRTKMPDSSEWDAIVSEGADKRLIQKIEMIREMKKNGSTVRCYSTDISDINETKAVFDLIKAQYGNIRGVIHGAGLAGDGFMITRNHQDFCNVLAPKIQGTWVLDKLTEDEKMDFFILFSSISAICPEVGQGDYTSANSYLDSYSSYRSKKGKRVLSINWPAWNEVGMAVDHGVDMESEIFKSVSTEDALRVFEKAIQSEVERVILGQLNLEQLARQEDQLPFEIKGAVKQQADNIKENIDSPVKTNLLLTESRLPTDTENVVHSIWRRVLGLKQVDLSESFYDQGGNSILATHLWKELNKEFPDVIDISDIFTHSSIEDMVQYITSKLEPAVYKPSPELLKDEYDMDKLLEKLANGEITEDQLDELM